MPMIDEMLMGFIDLGEIGDKPEVEESLQEESWLDVTTNILIGIQELIFCFQFILLGASFMFCILWTVRYRNCLRFNNEKSCQENSKFQNPDSSLVRTSFGTDLASAILVEKNNRKYVHQRKHSRVIYVAQPGVSMPSSKYGAKQGKLQPRYDREGQQGRITRLTKSSTTLKPSRLKGQPAASKQHKVTRDSSQDMQSPRSNKPRFHNTGRANELLYRLQGESPSNRQSGKVICRNITSSDKVLPTKPSGYDADDRRFEAKRGAAVEKKVRTSILIDEFHDVSYLIDKTAQDKRIFVRHKKHASSVRKSLKSTDGWKEERTSGTEESGSNPSIVTSRLYKRHLKFLEMSLARSRTSTSTDHHSDGRLPGEDLRFKFLDRNMSDEGSTADSLEDMPSSYGSGDGSEVYLWPGCLKADEVACTHLPPNACPRLVSRCRKPQTACKRVPICTTRYAPAGANKCHPPFKAIDSTMPMAMQRAQSLPTSSETSSSDEDTSSSMTSSQESHRVVVHVERRTYQHKTQESKPIMMTSAKREPLVGSTECGSKSLERLGIAQAQEERSQTRCLMAPPCECSCFRGDKTRDLPSLPEEIVASQSGSKSRSVYTTATDIRDSRSERPAYESDTGPSLSSDCSFAKVDDIQKFQALNSETAAYHKKNDTACPTKLTEDPGVLKSVFNVKERGEMSTCKLLETHVQSPLPERPVFSGLLGRAKELNGPDSGEDSVVAKPSSAQCQEETAGWNEYPKMGIHDSYTDILRNSSSDVGTMMESQSNDSLKQLQNRTFHGKDGLFTSAEEVGEPKFPSKLHRQYPCTKDKDVKIHVTKADPLPRAHPGKEGSEEKHALKAPPLDQKQLLLTSLASESSRPQLNLKRKVAVNDTCTMKDSAEDKGSVGKEFRSPACALLKYLLESSRAVKDIYEKNPKQTVLSGAIRAPKVTRKFGPYFHPKCGPNGVKRSPVGLKKLEPTRKLPPKITLGQDMDIPRETPKPAPQNRLGESWAADGKLLFDSLREEQVMTFPENLDNFLEGSTSTLREEDRNKGMSAVHKRNHECAILKAADPHKSKQAKTRETLQSSLSENVPLWNLLRKMNKNNTSARAESPRAKKSSDVFPNSNIKRLDQDNHDHAEAEPVNKKRTFLKGSTTQNERYNLLLPNQADIGKVSGRRLRMCEKRRNPSGDTSPAGQLASTQSSNKTGRSDILTKLAEKTVSQSRESKIPRLIRNANLIIAKNNRMLGVADRVTTTFQSPVNRHIPVAPVPCVVPPPSISENEDGFKTLGLTFRGEDAAQGRLEREDILADESRQMQKAASAPHQSAPITRGRSVTMPGCADIQAVTKELYKRLCHILPQLMDGSQEPIIIITPDNTKLESTVNRLCEDAGLSPNIQVNGHMKEGSRCSDQLLGYEDPEALLTRTYTKGPSVFKSRDVAQKFGDKGNPASYEPKRQPTVVQKIHERCEQGTEHRTNYVAHEDTNWLFMSGRSTETNQSPRVPPRLYVNAENDTLVRPNERVQCQQLPWNSKLQSKNSCKGKPTFDQTGTARLSQKNHLSQRDPEENVTRKSLPYLQTAFRPQQKTAASSGKTSTPLSTRVSIISKQNAQLTKREMLQDIMAKVKTISTSSRKIKRKTTDTHVKTKEDNPKDKQPLEDFYLNTSEPRKFLKASSQTCSQEMLAFPREDNSERHRRSLGGSNVVEAKHKPPSEELLEHLANTSSNLDSLFLLGNKGPAKTLDSVLDFGSSSSNGDGKFNNRASKMKPDEGRAVLDEMQADRLQKEKDYVSQRRSDPYTSCGRNRETDQETRQAVGPLRNMAHCPVTKDKEFPSKVFLKSNRWGGARSKPVDNAQRNDAIKGHDQPKKGDSSPKDDFCAAPLLKTVYGLSRPDFKLTSVSSPACVSEDLQFPEMSPKQEEHVWAQTGEAESCNQPVVIRDNIRVKGSAESQLCESNPSNPAADHSPLLKYLTRRKLPDMFTSLHKTKENAASPVHNFSPKMRLCVKENDSNPRRAGREALQSWRRGCSRMDRGGSYAIDSPTGKRADKVKGEKNCKNLAKQLQEPQIITRQALRLRKQNESASLEKKTKFPAPHGTPLKRTKCLRKPWLTRGSPASRPDASQTRPAGGSKRRHSRYLSPSEKTGQAERRQLKFFKHRGATARLERSLPPDREKDRQPKEDITPVSDGGQVDCFNLLENMSSAEEERCRLPDFLPRKIRGSFEDSASTELVCSTLPMKTSALADKSDLERSTEAKDYASLLSRSHTTMPLGEHGLHYSNSTDRLSNVDNDSIGLGAYSHPKFGHINHKTSLMSHKENTRTVETKDTSQRNQHSRSDREGHDNRNRQMDQTHTESGEHNVTKSKARDSLPANAPAVGKIKTPHICPTGQSSLSAVRSSSGVLRAERRGSKKRCEEGRPKSSPAAIMQTGACFARAGRSQHRWPSPNSECIVRAPQARKRDRILLSHSAYTYLYHATEDRSSTSTDSREFISPGKSKRQLSNYHQQATMTPSPQIYTPPRRLISPVKSDSYQLVQPADLSSLNPSLLNKSASSMCILHPSRMSSSKDVSEEAGKILPRPLPRFKRRDPSVPALRDSVPSSPEVVVSWLDNARVSGIERSSAAIKSGLDLADDAPVPLGSMWGFQDDAASLFSLGHVAKRSPPCEIKRSLSSISP